MQHQFGIVIQHLEKIANELDRIFYVFILGRNSKKKREKRSLKEKW